MNPWSPCPRFGRAMDILGKKWTCLILRCLLGDARRFTDISAYVSGLSDRLLSQRLQEMEEAGIIRRRVYAERPVAVEYALTPKGAALRRVVEAIQRWADEWDSPASPAKTEAEVSFRG